MGLYLIEWLELLIVIIEVAIGLGMVIFVHELGHFVVAKLCGVKCEKFYLGFDIGGWRLCRFRWGETEYGIGALPLGGYVKMLGQEDNPARLREELERANVDFLQKIKERDEAKARLEEAERAVADAMELKRQLYEARHQIEQELPELKTKPEYDERSDPRWRIPEQFYSLTLAQLLSESLSVLIHE